MARIAKTWAPQTLVTRYGEAVSSSGPPSPMDLREVYCCINDEQRVWLLHNLVNDERMRKAWESLEKRRGCAEGDDRKWAESNDYAEDLWLECLGIFETWSRTPKRSRAESAALFTRIADLAGQLGAELMSLETDPADSLLGLDLIEPKQVEDLVRALDIIYQAEKPMDGRHQLVGVLANDLLQPFTVMLIRLMCEAREKAKSNAGLTQPNSPDAIVHFFVRRLNAYFVEHYGARLHRQVSLVSSAIFNRDVTEESVRALVRYSSRSKAA